MHEAPIEILTRVPAERPVVCSPAGDLAEKLVEPDEPDDGVGDVTRLLGRNALKGEGGAVTQALGHRVQHRPPHRGRAAEAEAGHTGGQALAKHPGLREREVAANREKVLPELEAFGEINLTRYGVRVMGKNFL